MTCILIMLTLPTAVYESHEYWAGSEQGISSRYHLPKGRPSHAQADHFEIRYFWHGSLHYTDVLIYDQGRI